MKTTPAYTEDQKVCINALAHWAGGHHHLPSVQEFGNGVAVNWHGDLSTFDFDRLTRLVLLAHQFAIRIEIASSGPRLVKIIAHRRRHGERKALKCWEYHPGLVELQQAAETAKGWIL